MAKPLTLAQITRAHDKWGCPYRVIEGAAKRSNSRGWSVDDGITGCMDHHTASSGSDAVNLRVVRDGRAGLRGPLCNFGVPDTGIIDIVAVGAANHAGGGDPETLAAVMKELTPLDREIRPDESSSSSRAVNGNPRFYGWEVYYGIGADTVMKPLQYRAMVLSNTAIIDALDAADAYTWTGRAVIGHREWTKAKPDPVNVKMFEVRVLVNRLRAAGPEVAAHWYRTGSFTLPKPTTPTAPITEEDTMKLVQMRGTKPVYKTDGFQRQHIGPLQYEELKDHYPKILVDTEVELNAYGPEVQNDAPGGAQ